MNTLILKDPVLAQLIQDEEERQLNTISLIPSENIAYEEVRKILSSNLSNKYSEGYAQKRYYNGNTIIDQIEELAINRVCEAFGTKYANVQSYSGSPANNAIYTSLLTKGDTVLGFDLSCGGHLTHGAKVNFSGKDYNSITYKLNSETMLLDYDEIEKLAIEHKPKLIVCGTTAYSRALDFEKFASLRDKIKNITGECYLLADISHISMLVLSNNHVSPVGFADIIMTTTHKGLRGPRGAIITTNDEIIIKKVNKSVFPGLQGGPHNATTAAIAYTFNQINTDEFIAYNKRILGFRQMFEDALIKNDFNIVTGGSDNHLLLLDLRNKNITGKLAADKLEENGIIVNMNGIPFDTNPPMNPSGIRIGTPWLAAIEYDYGNVNNLVKKFIDILK